ncbi:uncharacterized protein SCODWIG_01292 [Saccharomycodes ludwigii]|uniref:Ubiquitin-like protein ATG12 n=1 Tax=Saccharomycodes ludwigii TaxID=36035 RepID=A0A376B4G3_9ASCO|nr:hypothetical protein SCDLUD_000984 [Saccharomycodes ludwigii]KAH3903355.1 hypothetical protein SCDLUD_000984 [Saccharomycodes ludwigii]SSD59531.1 uncharacterized protein SCODWIG_01292 [Saccharomycodes ludwigii]
MDHSNANVKPEKQDLAISDNSSLNEKKKINISEQLQFISQQLDQLTHTSTNNTSDSSNITGIDTTTNNTNNNSKETSDFNSKRIPINISQDNIKNNKEKINIRFSPIGGSIKQINTKMIIASYQPFSTIIQYIKKRLNLPHVYLYINNSFAPSGQQLVGELYEQFGIGDELCVSYCGGVAFG